MSVLVLSCWRHRADFAPNPYLLHMRDTIIRKAAVYVLEQGVADESIRTIAQNIGTSHRMINYHFGSSEAFWEALINEIRRIELENAKKYVLNTSTPAEFSVSTAWRHFATPEYQKIFRIIFEIYVKVLRSPKEHEAFVGSFVNEWLEIMSESFARHHRLGSEEARRYARLRLACIRGLMIDLLLTQESESTHQVAALFDDMLSVHINNRSSRTPAS